MNPVDPAYTKAVQTLCKLNDQFVSNKTPFQKLVIFGELSVVVKKEISDFWKGINIKQEKLQLDSDQMIMIFAYIVCLARVQSLFAHIQFCKEFSTPNMTQTRYGYCLTTLEVAVTLLADEKDLIQMEDEQPEADMFDPQKIA